MNQIDQAEIMKVIEAKQLDPIEVKAGLTALCKMSYTARTHRYCKDAFDYILEPESKLKNWENLHAAVRVEV